MESSKSNPLRFDIGVLPSLFDQNNVGFNTYFNAETFSKNQKLNWGIGVFFVKDNKPSSVIGGLVWEFADLTNQLEADDEFYQRGGAFSYIGYVLNSNNSL